MSTKKISAEDIVNVAREAVGVPFKHMGRDTTGLDCVGLLIFSAKKLKIKHSDLSSYSRRPNNGQLEQVFDKAVLDDILVRVPKEDMQAGDFIMMRFFKEPQHLGIYTGSSLIHSYQSIGKVCEHIIDEKWLKRIVRVYRLKGLANE